MGIAELAGEFLTNMTRTSEMQTAANHISIRQHEELTALVVQTGNKTHVRFDRAEEANKGRLQQVTSLHCHGSMSTGIDN